MTAGPMRTVPAVLARFDTTFSQFATAFGEGQYVLWLGSGISRDRVPNVVELLERVIEFLRVSINPDNQACEYRSALDSVLSLASMTDDERATVNITIPFEDWTLRERIAGVLVGQYSKVLDIRIEGKARDYLVWDVLDVPETYGSPDIEPDVEHYCIALLMLEGLVDSAVTANWDGLVEKALGDLMPEFNTFARVIVKPDDFLLPKRPVEFVKFHGCAVRARDDAEYRSLLIARLSQISVWATKWEHRLIRKRLESLYTERPTLMLGLSAQDANLHLIFGAAAEDLVRPWSSTTAPAVVLSEEQLFPHHSHVLEITYGADYNAHATAISNASVLGSFGKPTLLALVLSSPIQKLAFFLEQVLQPTWDQADIQRLTADLVGLRDFAASYTIPCNAEMLKPQEISEFQMEFVARLIDVTHLVLTVFRTGSVPCASGRRYEPLSDRPAAQAIHNPDFPLKEFGLLGVALALVGRGQVSGHWVVRPGDRRAPSNGVLRLVTDQRETQVFFVKNAATLTKLQLDETYDDRNGNAFVVIADEEPKASIRSPRSRFGRDGKTEAGRFSIASTVADTASSDNLFEAFRLAGGF
ncbi:SIR2 family protein [Arthrobacter sp. Hz1]